MKTRVGDFRILSLIRKLECRYFLRIFANFLANNVYVLTFYIINNLLIILLLVLIVFFLFPRSPQSDDAFKFLDAKVFTAFGIMAFCE